MIFVGMNHPKHFWMFKNLIHYFDKNQINYKVFVSDKDVLCDLLDGSGIDYNLLGKNKKGVFKKIIQLFSYIRQMGLYTLKEKPSILIGQALPHFAFISAFFRNINFIILEDTEHVTTLHKFTVPFCKYIFTPKTFPNKFGTKQISINSFYELLYLHPENFKPKAVTLLPKQIGFNKKYIVMRKVSWNAHHDRGLLGISDEFIRNIINIFSLHHISVYISSEGAISNEFKQHLLEIPPIDIHHVLHNAEMYIGEGATLAAEAALVGTPSIYINPLNTSFCSELANDYDLIYNYRNEVGVVDHVKQLLTNDELKSDTSKKLNKLLIEKYNPVPFFINEIQKLL